MSATLPNEVVLDASAAVRGFLQRAGSAKALVNEVAAGRTAGHVPDLFVAEVTSAFRVRVAVERWPLPDALHALEVFSNWPLTIQPCRSLAGAALEAAGELGISAYDAFYAVLSALLDAPLVTADRKLAAAVPGAVLVS